MRHNSKCIHFRINQYYILVLAQDSLFELMQCLRWTEALQSLWSQILLIAAGTRQTGPILARLLGGSWCLSVIVQREGHGSPRHCSRLENPRDPGAWWAAVYGVAQGWTRLKRFSSSSNMIVKYLIIALCLKISGLPRWRWW